MTGFSLSWRTLARVPTLAILAVVLVACGSWKLPNFANFDWPEMVLVAAPNANLNSAVAFDAVFIRESDVGMVEKVGALPASKWFAMRNDLVKTFPTAVSYKSWELAPGQTIKVPGMVFDSFGSPRVVAVFLFADYATPGDHRLRADQLQNRIVVRLEQKGFAVTSDKND